MDPVPGAGGIVDQAVEDAAQTLFTAADVPLSGVDELLKLIQGPAVRLVMEKRIEQVVKHGHTPEGDRDLPIDLLAREARNIAQAAIEVMSPGDRCNLPVARNRLAKSAALLLAAIDRVDVQIAINREGGAA